MSIFVSIASYRDRDCSETLHNLYAAASNPSSIYVGICEQNHPTDPSEVCHAVRGVIPEQNVRRVSLHHSDARGPCWARYLCSTMYQGEEFYLQIDSHMRFVKDWDAKLIAMLDEIGRVSGTSSVILSTYVRSVEDYCPETMQSKDDAIPQICQAYWDSNDMITLHGAAIVSPSKPAKSVPFVAGGFMFVRARPFLDDVPYDPELKDVFTGEEILFSARAWTAGYDIFTPTENVAFHEFTRADAPKFWNDNARDDSLAMRRVRYLLKFSQDKPADGQSVRGLDCYGMGNKRSLADYFAFAGIDRERRAITKNFCQNSIIPNPAPQNDLPRTLEKLGPSLKRIVVALVVILTLLLAWLAFVL